MDRVVVTRAMVGICHMQVCAAKDATDEEILRVCNRENMSGTQNGWSSVIRGSDDFFTPPEKAAPIPCGDDADRLHILVAC